MNFLRALVICQYLKKIAETKVTKTVKVGVT